jgi:biotin-dependent carboxylase-like uncharacterized protein
MKPALRVLQPGMLTTVQDLGRAHTQQLGVPVGGAMDQFACRAANRLVGNAVDAAVLEVTGSNAAFELLTPLIVAVTGANLEVTLDSIALSTWTTFLARAGQELHLGPRQTNWGARCYIAVNGGINVPKVLESRSTNLAAAFGGLEGRALRAGDTLAQLVAPFDVLRTAGKVWPLQARPPYSARPTLRIIPGPHLDVFAERTLDTLTAAEWRIGQQSNRIGYRLEGVTLPYIRNISIASHGVIPGAIQVPPDGSPILLMADAQTTGGYPIIGVVIGADLPLAAQLLPNDSLSFAPTTIDKAVNALQTTHRHLQTPLIENDCLEQLNWAEAPGGQLLE